MHQHGHFRGVIKKKAAFEVLHRVEKDSVQYQKSFSGPHRIILEDEMGWTSKAHLFWHTSIIPLVDSRAAIGPLQIRIVSSRLEFRLLISGQGIWSFVQLQKRGWLIERLKYYGMLLRFCTLSYTKSTDTRHAAHSQWTPVLSQVEWPLVNICAVCVSRRGANYLRNGNVCACCFSSSASNAPLFLQSKVCVCRQILGSRVPTSQRHV